MTSKKFLLIGGGGFLGRNLERVLCNHGHYVTIIDKSAPDYSQKRNTSASETWHSLDLNDTDTIKRIATENKITHVILLASGILPGSPPGTIVSELNNVITPSFKLIDKLASLGIKLIFFSSGGTVYGTHSATSYTEDIPLLPISEYGYSKIILEQYIQLVSRTKGLEYLIVRPSNPFGRWQNPHLKQGIVAVAANKIIRNQPIEIWGDGSVIRDYIWVDDLTECLMSLIENQLAWNNIYNLGSGTGHSVNEVIATLEKHLGKPAITRYLPTRTVDVPEIVLDISRLKAVIPTNFHSFDAAISKYVELLK